MSQCVLHPFTEASLQLEVPDKDDRAVVSKCITRYTRPTNLTQFMQSAAYRISECVRGFFGKSDWECATRILARLAEQNSVEPFKWDDSPESASTSVVQHTASERLSLMVELQNSGQMPPLPPALADTYSPASEELVSQFKQGLQDRDFAIANGMFAAKETFLKLELSQDDEGEDTFTDIDVYKSVLYALTSNGEHKNRPLTDYVGSQEEVEYMAKKLTADLAPEKAASHTRAKLESGAIQRLNNSDVVSDTLNNLIHRDLEVDDEKIITLASRITNQLVAEKVVDDAAKTTKQSLDNKELKNLTRDVVVTTFNECVQTLKGDNGCSTIPGLWIKRAETELINYFAEKVSVEVIRHVNHNKTGFKEKAENSAVKTLREFLKPKTIDDLKAINQQAKMIVYNYRSANNIRH